MRVEDLSVETRLGVGQRRGACTRQQASQVAVAVAAVTCTPLADSTAPSYSEVLVLPTLPQRCPRTTLALP